MPLDASIETAFVGYMSGAVATRALAAGRAVDGPFTDNYAVTLEIDDADVTFYRGRSPEEMQYPAVISECIGMDEDADARGNWMVRLQVSLVVNADNSDLTPDTLETANWVADWIRDALQVDDLCAQVNTSHHGDLTLIGLVDSARSSLQDGRAWMQQWTLSIYSAETDLVVAAPG